ncbi:MAG: hypothetical protein H6539_04265 [Bacteroidales bacterium]|nr:hypothetical protein [Bacteroidales bacterium]
MKTILKLSLLSVFMLFATGFGPQKIDYRTGRYNNVCKDLKNEVLLYFVFIDTRTTSPWTEFDIKSTIDSMGVVVDWLEKQAEMNKIFLRIKSDYYIGKSFATISKDLPLGTVLESVTEPNLKQGNIQINKWANYVSKKIGDSFVIEEKDGIPKLQNPKDTERLIAYLRDEYKVESVALIFMVNNYYRTDISYAVNTLTNANVEYAIVSYKYPAEIAHSFLRLYGAADLYETPLRKSSKKIQLASELLPNDIMQDPYAKNIWGLEISDFTKYLIGWTNEIDPRYEDLLTERISLF